MTKIAVGLVALAVVLCGVGNAQERNGTAELSGVIRGAGGVAVVLHLRSMEDNPTRYYDGYEETAGKDGSFRFADIKPGKYRLEVSGDGLALPEPEAVTLAAGERRRGLSPAVMEVARLCGRVTENGVGKGSNIELYRLNEELNTLSQVKFVRAADGRFDFRGLSPGTYFLRAYMTWFPGSFGFTGATPIVVTATSPRGCGFEIPMQSTSCTTSKISGTIGGSDNGAVYRLWFLERTEAGGGFQGSIASNFYTTYKSGDSFSATVCRGDYDLVLSTDQQFVMARGEIPGGKVAFNTQRVDARAGPVEDVVLTPKAVGSIAGEVRFEGIKPNESCPGLGGQHVSILREGDGQFQTVMLDDKNHFSFQNVAPGSYTIYLGPFKREAVYVDSILVDGKAAAGRRFEIAEAKPVSVVVTLSGDVERAAGHISPDVRREERWEMGWARPKGIVAGKVTGTGGGDITVKLRSARYNSDGLGEYAIKPAADGSFAFAAVDPGVYTLRVEGKGILTSEYGALAAQDRGVPLVVERGANIVGLKLTAATLSAVCGRMTDEDGAALPQKSVWLYLDAERGRGLGYQLEDVHQINSVGGWEPAVQTDADGRFRLEGLKPGAYFVSAPMGTPHPVFFSADGTLRTAEPLRVEAGKDLGCGEGGSVALRLPAGYKQTFDFGGKVSGEIPASEGDRFWVTLTDVRDSGAQSFVGTAQVDGGRSFKFEGVPAGRFLMQLHSGFAKDLDRDQMLGDGNEEIALPYQEPPTHVLASETVDVRTGMADVTIAAVQLPTVSGVVHFSHIPANYSTDVTSRQSISLVPPHEGFDDMFMGFRGGAGAMVKEDGSFDLGVVDVGTFRLQMSMFGSLHLQSVRLNGKEVSGSLLTLTAGEHAELEVEISGDVSELNHGEVTAKVIADGSAPRPEPSVTEACVSGGNPMQYAVVLIPDPLVPRTAGDDPPIQLGSAWYNDPTDIRYRSNAIPAGSYRVIAAQAVGVSVSSYVVFTASSSQEDRRRWEALSALGEPLVVKAGDKLELTLPDRTLEVERLGAKLGVGLGRGLLDR